MAKRTLPEICACTKPTKFDRETGKTTCPGQVVCAPPSKQDIPGKAKPALALKHRYALPEPRDVALDMEPGAGAYTTQSDPCKTGRLGCPVQLIFKANKPHLRFCGASKMVTRVDRKTGAKREVRVGAEAPGWIVPVRTPTEARALAAEACAQWQKTRSFTASNAAVIKAKAERAGIGPDQALGRLRRR